MNRYLVKATGVGALGGLLFGFDTAVIAGTTQQLTDIFHLTPFSLGVTVFMALAGTVVGAMTSGVLGQKIGGREALRIMAVLYTISAFGSAFAWNWHSLLVFRFIGGLGIGGSSVLGPVYIAELAPPQWRGRMVGLFQINIVSGILLAYLSNYIIAALGLGALQWRWEFGIAIVPSILFLLLLFGIPRSSRWLVSTHRTDEALDVLKLMGSPNSQAELQEMIDSVHLESGLKREPLFIPKYRFPIFLAISLGLLNQLSGINAILYYSNQIFASAGFSSLSGALQTVLVGLVNLAATLLGMSLVDKLGRKTLLLIGSVGMAFSLSGVAWIFFSNSHRALLVWLLMGFILFFAISQGSVIWVYLAEIFPTRVRSKGQSLGSSSHWIMNAALALVFPIVAKGERLAPSTHAALNLLVRLVNPLLARTSPGVPFAFFAIMMAAQFFLVFFVFPETKGVSLEELQRRLGIE